MHTHTHTNRNAHQEPKTEHGKADTIVLTGGMEYNRFAGNTWNRSRVLYAFIIDISLQLHLASSTHTSVDLLSWSLAHTSPQQMYCNKLNGTNHGFPFSIQFFFLFTIFSLSYSIFAYLFIRLDFATVCSTLWIIAEVFCVYIYIYTTKSNRLNWASKGKWMCEHSLKKGSNPLQI